MYGNIVQNGKYLVLVGKYLEIFKYMPPIKYAEMLAYLCRVKANTYFEKSLKKISKGGDGSDHMYWAGHYIFCFSCSLLLFLPQWTMLL